MCWEVNYSLFSFLSLFGAGGEIGFAREGPLRLVLMSTAFFSAVGVFVWDVSHLCMSCYSVYRLGNSDEGYDIFRSPFLMLDVNVLDGYDVSS